jgi:hypothetical protein
LNRTSVRIVTALVLWGFITHSTFAGTGDEPHYLAIAHSIAFDFDLNLANNYGGAEPLIAGGGLDAGPHVRTGAGGVVRPVHDIGMPLLFAPVVRVAAPAVEWTTTRVSADLLRRGRLTPTVLYRHSLALVMIAMATVLTGLMFDALIGAGSSPRRAFAITLLVMLSPPLLFFSVLFFTELLSALLCFFSFRRIAGNDLQGVTAWAVTGAAAGLLMLVHARNVGLVIGLIVFGGLMAWRTGQRRQLAAFLAGAAVLLVARTAVNYAFWGALVTNPHASLGAWSGWRPMAGEILTRAAGILVDQEYGVLIYAPIYALATIGLIAMMKERASPQRRTAIAILLVTGVYLALVLLPLTNVQGWTGGWSPPARFLTPILPLLLLPLSSALGVVPRAVLLVVLVLQIGINLTLWQAPKLGWNDGDGTAAFCSRTSLTVCTYLPSFVKR